MPCIIIRFKKIARYLLIVLLGIGIPSTIGYLITLQERAVSTTAPAPFYQGPGEKRRIALTVNVYWGEEYLPKMLQRLRENKVKATFFLGGQWVEKFPDLSRDIARDFEIGSHGYTHPHPDQLSLADNLTEITRSETAIRRATGRKPHLFAPPYGESGPAVLDAAYQADYRVILWSIDPVDWRNPPAAAISGKIISKAHNGAIVLLHPTAPTVEALPAIISELTGRGFEFSTVSELLAGS
ncbi:MAG: polysaccharide deacetylase family protein [Bacillota bacterium]